ncbi:MAG: hypothetical protein HOP33_03685 [Verrucomicrobia bacterium]|nr:hypothetical protein [Verrucomicrobiota bacterium]
MAISYAKSDFKASHRLLQKAKVRRPCGSSGCGRASAPQTLIVQNLCGWEDQDTNLWRKIDPQVFALHGFAIGDAQTTLPARVAANIKNI